MEYFPLYVLISDGHFVKVDNLMLNQISFLFINKVTTYCNKNKINNI